jgi:DNA-directed RNA polymerase specialized sigma24 family protein
MSTLVGKHAFDESWLRAAKDGSLPRLASQDPRFSAILALPDFERFVYVLSVLEGCSDQQCAALLGVSPQQIEETRLRALRHFWKRD